MCERSRSPYTARTAAMQSCCAASMRSSLTGNRLRGCMCGHARQRREARHRSGRDARATDRLEAEQAARPWSEARQSGRRYPVALLRHRGCDRFHGVVRRCLAIDHERSFQRAGIGRRVAPSSACERLLRLRSRVPHPTGRTPKTPRPGAARVRTCCAAAPTISPCFGSPPRSSPAHSAARHAWQRTDR